MNRLSAVPASSATSPRRHERLDARVERLQNRRSAPHSLLAPLHYEPNYAYPLVVWLHGPAGHEREVRRVMPLVSLRNYAAASVRGTLELGSGSSRPGYDWEQSPAGIQAAEQRVAEAVEQACERFHIHPGRIFLCGLQSGGTMAIRLALHCADRYAGAISINGAFPQNHSPLARLSAARRAKLLIAHCRDSETYPIEQLCDELSLFHAAGMSVTLRQYPCGDELTTQMLTDMDAWLMEQVTGSAPSGSPEPGPLPSDWN